MALYNASGNFRVTVGDTTRTGIYAADGSLRVTIVSGTTYTGLFAADGSYNVVVVAATDTPISLYHSCGAFRGVAVSASASNYGAIAPNGALYMEGLFAAAAFAGSKTNVLSWCFDDTAGAMGSVVIRDTVTSANNFTSADTAAILAKFTGWSATSTMTVRGRDGTLKHAPHNLLPYSEDVTNWGNWNGTPTKPNATTLGDDDVGTNEQAYQTAVTVSGLSYQAIVHVGKDSDTSRLVRVDFEASGGSSRARCSLNTSTGASTDVSTGGATFTVTDGGASWVVALNIVADSTSSYVIISPAASGATTGTVTINRAYVRCMPAPDVYVKTTSAAVFTIPTTYDTSGNKLGFLDWEARTNAAWWSRDLTQSAHVKTNATAYLTAKGTDGIAGSASRLAITAANGNVIQQITAASAQRVSSAKVRRAKGSGTVKMSQGETTGSELVTNGTFATDISGWTNASLGTGTATWSGGKAVLARTNSANQGILRQSFSTTAGKAYRVGGAVTVASGKIGVGNSALDDSIVNTTVGAGSTIDQVFIATAATTHLYIIATADASSPEFDNITCKECTSTTLSLTSPTYEEVTGTELVTNGDFSNGTTGYTPVNATISVVGGECEVVATAGVPQFLKSISCTVGKLYRVTGTARRGTCSQPVYLGINGIGSDSTNNTINTALTFYFVATSTSHEVQAYTTGASVGETFYIDNVSVKEVSPTQLWTEVETAAATITNPCVAIWSDTSGDALDIDHVQCEVPESSTQKAGPSIITAGAAVTRTATNLGIATTAFPSMLTAGTIVAWGRRNAVDTTNNQYVARLVDNAGNNAVDLYINNAQGLSRIRSAGVDQDNLSLSATLAAGTLHKLAMAYALNDEALCVNGTMATGDDGTVALPAALDTLWIGAISSTTGFPHRFNGPIARIKVIPERFTDADLQAETV